jgi:hypothetical protein
MGDQTQQACTWPTCLCTAKGQFCQGAVRVTLQPALPPALDAVEALVKSEHMRLSMTPAQFANMERWRGYTEGLDAMRDAALAAIRAGGNP